MGVAKYEFKVTGLSMLATEAAGINYVNQEIRDILGALPFQVSLVKQTQYPSPKGLYDVVTLYLEHPTFIDGSEIKDLRKWERAIAFDEDGTLYQYNKNIGTLNYEEFLRETPDESRKR
jgi:hypothetical protein